MEKKTVVPERLCQLDHNMSLDKLVQAKENQSPVVGKVFLWNSQLNHFKVDLGNGFTGILPLEYASIYPTTITDGKLPGAVKSIIGNNVRLTVDSIDTELNQITLCRTTLMKEAIDLFSNSIGEKIECCVTSTSSFGVFVDVGNGVSGMIHFKNLCISRLKSSSELLNVGDKITAKILSVDSNFHVNLDYKTQFENLSYTLNRGDLVEATILAPINSVGCFAYVNPNTPAVIDLPLYVPRNYGLKVLAMVKRRKEAHPERLRLKFISFVE